MIRDTSLTMIASAMHMISMRAARPAASCRPTLAQNRLVSRAANIDVADMSALKPKKGTSIPHWARMIACGRGRRRAGSQLCLSSRNPSTRSIQSVDSTPCRTLAPRGCRSGIGAYQLTRIDACIHARILCCSAARAVSHWLTGASPDREKGEEEGGRY